MELTYDVSDTFTCYASNQEIQNRLFQVFLMYKLTFPAHDPKTFSSLDAAAEFMCTVPYGFISCTDENDDVSVQLCRLISKKLNNNSRLKKLKEDF